MSTDTKQEFLSRPSFDEDDSPFLSMADFFSLISLTLIYISIAFAPSGVLPQDAIPVLVGRDAQPGQTIAASANYAYLTLRAHEDGAALLIMPRGRSKSEMLTMSLVSPQIEIASAWIERKLVTGPTPERVIARISLGERSGELHRVFNRLVGSIRHDVPVSIVMIDEQE